MAADTETFLKLQKLYQQKAAKDLAVVTHHANTICNRIGKSLINEEEIKTFCRSTYGLKVIRYRSHEQEYNHPDKANIAKLLGTPDHNAIFYVLLRAVDRFYTTHHRFPGTFDDEVESDIPLLKTVVTGLLAEFGVDADKITNDYIHEICRFGASETHGIASYIGGVTAQEVLKLTTEKWTPLTNTHIFSGLNCTSHSFIV